MLKGKVALVTGGGSGIGAASAAALAKAGAVVTVTDIDAASATTVAEVIRQSGGDASAWTLDVSSESAWVDVLASVEQQCGPVTVLHSNAALTSPTFTGQDRGVIDLDLEVFDEVIAVNLRGALLGCKHVIPAMIAAGGGSVILTSSVKGSTGSAYSTAYSVSKAGLDALAKVIATGHGKRAIRCNAVAPGIIVTEATSQIPPDQLADLIDAHLTREIGRPEDIANVVVFLASNASSFITGQVLAVDGGLTAHTAALSPPGSRA